MKRFTPSRGGKYKRPALDLFNIASPAFEETVYEMFRETAYSLMSKGIGMVGPHITTCEDWWRSRFHDMLYPGHTRPTHEQWLFNHTAQINWPLIWERFKKEVL